MAEAPGPSACGVCHHRTARYICPRCNVRYCSLDCYKGHSERCTEGFYRDSTAAELKSITATEGEKQQMLDILQRLHEQQLEEGALESGGSSSSSSSSDDEAEGGGGLSRRTVEQLAMKLAAGVEISAADLTPQELQAFHRAVAMGEVSEGVQPWQPWWLLEEAAELELSEAGTSLVAALGEEEGGAGTAAPPSTTASALPPPPRRALPPLAALTRAQPSPLLQYHLLDLLYGYCFVLRLYNGDCSTDPGEAADVLFSLSAVLEAVAGGGEAAAAALAGATSVASSLLECISRACRPPAGSRQQQGVAVGVLSDVAAILRLGRPVVVTALMDLSRLLEAARQQLEGGPAWHSGGRASKEAKRLQRRLVAAGRKLLFFLSWANEQLPEVYSMLALAVGGELEKHSAVLAEQAHGGSSGGLAGAVGGGVAQLSAAARQTPRPPAGPLVEEL